MNTNVLIKLAIVLMMAIFVDSSVYGQIKVVSEDYAEQLTGSKNYYDNDISFDTIFPQANFIEGFGHQDAWIEYDSYLSYQIEWNRYNMIGDTVYIPENISFVENEQCRGYDYDLHEEVRYTAYNYSESFAVKIDSDSEICVNTLPKGYYVVTGYVFCEGNFIFNKYRKIQRDPYLEKISTSTGSSEYYIKINGKKYSYDYQLRRGTDEEYVKRVKECLVEAKPEYRGNCLRYDYIVLTSVNKSDGYDYVYYCRNLIDIRPFRVEFYSEFVKHFLGKEVFLKKYSDGFDKRGPFQKEVYNRGKKIKNGDVVQDALRGEKFKIADSLFVVKDLVLNKKQGESKYHVYCILEGKSSGSFSIPMEYLFYYSGGDDKPIKEVNQTYIPYGISFSSGYERIYNVMVMYIPEDYDLVLAMDKKRDEDRKLFNQKKEEQRQKEIEQVNLERKKERERIANEFEQRMIAKYGVENGRLIAKHQMAIGMTKEMCKDAWGTPINKYRTTTAGSVTEVWCYNYKTRIYFVNGKVQQIDD